ncbi:MAG: glycerophosphodiester phosphodiesterase family protein [Acholeplasmataceae bacterium]
MRTIKRILLAVLSLVTLWILLIISPKPALHEGENPFLNEDGLPLIIAHQGGKAEFPESTLEAYYNAYSVDQDVVFEADVVITKDDVLIISHDTTLDRVTDLPPNAPAHEINYSDLMENETNFAYQNEISGPNGIKTSDELIPYTDYRGETVTPLDVDYPAGVTARHETKFLALTLEELLTLFPEQRLVLEVKQTGEIGERALTALFELLDSLDPEYDPYGRIMFSTFHKDVFDRFLDLKESSYPDLMVAPQQDGVIRYYALHWLGLTAFFRLPISSLAVPMEEFDLSLHRDLFIRTAQRHNVAVHYWTINREQDMRELIEKGADGIITDHVTVLSDILADYAEES